MSSTGKETRNRINGQIRALEVRLIGDDGSQVGVVSIKEAKLAAETAGLDLVEISPNAEPPVVRVMDYGKFLFQESKQKMLARKKQKQVKVKELKFRPGTDKADYEVKLRNLRGFLEEGDKVKVTVFFRGREITHQELGMKLLERIRLDLAEDGKIDYFPRGAEGRQLVMIVSPKKK
ncbi:MAG: translation initiation factor IF-3 [Gammaproteobacteria bacterium]|nr:translation initiation factor IF-3 [Gammaproteobacteria bacterium]